MKRLWWTLCLLCLAMLVRAQAENSSQLQLHSFQESRSAAGMDNLGAKFIKNWPKDVNGDQDCAWVRVTFENMTKVDAGKVTFKFANSAPIEKTENHLEDEEAEVWLFVTPTSSTFMEAHLYPYGVSNRLSSLKLEPKHVYDVVLKNNKTMSINILTQPAGLHVRMVDTGEEAITPATFTGVGLGKHQISISKDNVQLKSDEIEVAEDNANFEYDLRSKKKISFKSEPSNVFLFIDDNCIGRTPLTKELAYGSYNIKAVLDEIRGDSKSITVNASSEDEIILYPIAKHSFTVSVRKEEYEVQSDSYEYYPVEADLYIDGILYEGDRLSSYQLTLFEGKHDIELVVDGRKLKRRVNVRSDMDVNQVFSFDISHNPKLKEYSFTVSARKEEYEVQSDSYEYYPVEADLYIDGILYEGDRLSSYQLTLFEGKHDIELVVDGRKLKRRVKVRSGMDVNQVFSFDIPHHSKSKKHSLDLSEAFNTSVQYIQKQYITKGNGHRLKESGVWGKSGENKWLSGIQLGFHSRPLFRYGLGLYTGLFYELYISEHDCSEEDFRKDNESMAADEYSTSTEADLYYEHNLYVPLHLLYKLDIVENFSLSAHCGLGFNYAIQGNYDFSKDWGTPPNFPEQSFGKNFNIAGEIGLDVHVYKFQLNLQYSMGLSNQKLHTDIPGSKTNMNKFSIGISYTHFFDKGNKK